jgi:energy-coupling factor transporter ATP-binding protein EcfA2
MRLEVRHTCANFGSYRAERVKSLFNCEDGYRFDLDAVLPLEGRAWQIGVIVGPSGSGKTSLGRKLGDIYQPVWADGPIIDGILPDGDFDAATAALSAVGLGSVPTWLRPYAVLSNGERFRADLARLVAEPPDGVTVVDEFSSVVDRQVAKVGAAAFAKAWRKSGRQVVLVSCHYDVLEWVQPDWLFDTGTGKFSGDCLWRRPEITLSIRKCSGSVWRHFEPHHYLKLPGMVAAQHYVGLVNEEPVAHIALSPRFQDGRVMRACRLVIMPEWQGIGVGLRFLDEVCRAQLRGDNRWQRQCFTLFHTSHPGLVAALRRRTGWLHSSASLHGGDRGKSMASLSRSRAKAFGGVESRGGHGGHLRAVHGFKFIGP